MSQQRAVRGFRQRGFFSPRQLAEVMGLQPSLSWLYMAAGCSQFWTGNGSNRDKEFSRTLGPFTRASGAKQAGADCGDRSLLRCGMGSALYYRWPAAQIFQREKLFHDV